MSRPPAEDPSAARRWSATHPEECSHFAQAMKSVNVFFFFRSLPSSYQARPISPPPRTWAKARTTPRWRAETFIGANHGS